MADRSVPVHEHGFETNGHRPFQKLLPGPDKEDLTEGFSREDEEGLVRVDVHFNGEAYISFNLERWNELHDLYNWPDGYEFDALSDGPFPIEVISGNILDVCIAKIEYIDYNYYSFVTPAVILLMDDGGFEWFFADPYMAHDIEGVEGSRYFCTFWKIPHKDTFGGGSFSYASTGEGVGEKTLYVTSVYGDKYDFRYLWMENLLVGCTWVCDAYDVEGHYVPGYYGVFTFGEDGAVVFEKGWVEDGPLRYTGTSDLSASGHGDQRPGILKLDLVLDSGSYAENIPKEIHGSFFAEMDGSTLLELWYSDGDPLYTEENLAWQYYAFGLDINPFYSEFDPDGIANG